MKRIHLGVGLATGRRSFKKVLLSHINIWRESAKTLPKDIEVHISLFVAYDVDYQNTQSTDFTNLSQEIVDAFDRIVFMGVKNAPRSRLDLRGQDAIPPEALRTVFGAGYAGKRNAVLLSAIEHGMDYLLFLDDDEYPLAVSHSEDGCLWSGQQVFLSHLKEIGHADFTNGRHCGYVSPIPQIAFDERLCQEDFDLFIRAISNDIITWESIRCLMDTGGVTYASKEVLAHKTVEEVPWENNCRFISGANLCINLTDPARTFPFYNPPGARGEDTFLSTMLQERRVVKIPCYTFHDGFSCYQEILNGALPIHLRRITAPSPRVATRFINACIGWVRYKPLLVYITQPGAYEERMAFIRSALEKTVPAFAAYFQDERFRAVPREFEKYCRNVKKHHAQYLLARRTWQTIIDRLG